MSAKACGQGLSSGTKALKSARRCAQEVGISGLTSHSSSLNFSDLPLKIPSSLSVDPNLGQDLDKLCDMLYKSLIKSSGRRVYLLAR